MKKNILALLVLTVGVSSVVKAQDASALNSSQGSLWKWVVGGVLGTAAGYGLYRYKSTHNSSPSSELQATESNNSIVNMQNNLAAHVTRNKHYYGNIADTEIMPLQGILSQKSDSDNDIYNAINAINTIKAPALEGRTIHDLNAIDSIQAIISQKRVIHNDGSVNTLQAPVLKERVANAIKSINTIKAAFLASNNATADINSINSIKAPALKEITVNNIKTIDTIQAAVKQDITNNLAREDFKAISDLQAMMHQASTKNIHNLYEHFINYTVMLNENLDKCALALGPLYLKLKQNNNSSMSVPQLKELLAQTTTIGESLKQLRSLIRNGGTQLLNLKQLALDSSLIEKGQENMQNIGNKFNKLMERFNHTYLPLLKINGAYGRSLKHTLEGLGFIEQ